MHFHQVLTRKATKSHRLVRNFYTQIFAWWKWLWALVTMKTFEIGKICEICFSPVLFLLQIIACWKWLWALATRKTFEIGEISKKLFFCNHCQKLFPKKQCKDICTAEKHYFCDYCLKTFFLSANLKKHSIHKNGSQKFFLKRKNTYWRETISLWSVS